MCQNLNSSSNSSNYCPTLQQSCAAPLVCYSYHVRDLYRVEAPCNLKLPQPDAHHGPVDLQRGDSSGNAPLPLAPGPTM